MKSTDEINHDEMIPLDFHMSQNYPNPFTEKTKIKYCIAYKTRVNIVVISPEGDVIKSLVNADQEAGTYELEFCGVSLPAGIYSLRLSAGDYVENKKMILVK